ncbi:MAG TPA: hypothetical protein VFW94_15135 [Candidatus Acidoferrales bacterium]|nr:hypothetical protein [Candidatus Acidoferrales bacterium]
MISRLGNVVYWGCTAAAILWAIFTFIGISTSAQPQWDVWLAITAMISLPLWVAGWAVRYVLVGTRRDGTL